MVGIKASAPSQAPKPPSSAGGAGHDIAALLLKTRMEAEELGAKKLESGEEHEDAKRAANADEEESRYDIRDKREPPAKRRRIGTQQDMHTVYTSDEDEDDVQAKLQALPDATVPLGLLAHLSLDNPKARKGKRRGNVDGSDNEEVGVANETYFLPGKPLVTSLYSSRSLNLLVV